MLTGVPPTGLGPLTLTIGNFDGMHRGHRELVTALKQAGSQHQVPTAVMTLEPHPLRVLDPDRAPPQIFSLPDLEAELRQLSVDHLIVIRFDEAFARLSADEFFQRYILDPLQPRALVVGWDFRFGSGRGGNADWLRGLLPEHGVELNVIDPVAVDGERVSSSRIRRLIQAGEVDRAWRFLGRPFFLDGRVVTGDGRGRHLGFPTANVRTDRECLPAPGVYVTQTELAGQVHASVTNVGVAPTFNTGAEATLRIESHLYEDGFQDLYGAMVRLRFYRQLRPERRFASVDELKLQISTDIRQTKEFFAQHALG